METKSFLLSKTFWFNVFSFLWQFFGASIGLPTLDDATFSGLLTFANIVLRFISKGGISIT